jgi:uncharacterized membrane protein
MLQILLVFHLFFAIWLMGNLITSAFWKKRADRSGNLEHIASTAQALVRSDYTFTGPGIVGLLVTGIWMVGLTGWRRFEEPWLAISFLLTILIVILWLAVLLPQQRRMARLAQEGAANGSPEPGYQSASKVWSIAGGIVTLIPVIILFLMVLKP